jgi:hypothetical protein
MKSLFCLFDWLFWAAWAIAQLYVYLAGITIIDDNVANLGLCLALTVFSSEDSFTCHTYCDTGPPSWRSYPKDPWFSLLNALGLTRPAWAGLELTTSPMISECTTTTLKLLNIMEFKLTSVCRPFWVVLEKIGSLLEPQISRKWKVNGTVQENYGRNWRLNTWLRIRKSLYTILSGFGED